MCLSSLHMLRLLCLDRYELAMNLSFFCLLSWKYIIFKIELIAIRIWFGYQKWERQYCLQYISWCCKNGGWFFVNIGLEVCPFSVFFSSSFSLLLVPSPSGPWNPSSTSLAHLFICVATYPSAEGRCEAHRCVFQVRKTRRVATNIYLRKTFGKTKKRVYEL